VTTKDDLYSVTGASLFLSVAATTVRRHADSGLLPCIRDSANVRLFKRSDLERFRRKHRIDNFRGTVARARGVRP
jgi:DNA-binding transcriptional MerR regulator